MSSHAVFWVFGGNVRNIVLHRAHYKWHTYFSLITKKNNLTCEFDKFQQDGAALFKARILFDNLFKVLPGRDISTTVETYVGSPW